MLKHYNERELQSAIEMALYKHGIEQALHRSEKTKRLLVNATQDILFLLKTGGTFHVVNDALTKIAGKTPEQLLNTSEYDLVSKKILALRRHAGR